MRLSTTPMTRPSLLRLSLLILQLPLLLQGIFAFTALLPSLRRPKNGPSLLASSNGGASSSALFYIQEPTEDTANEDFLQPSQSDVLSQPTPAQAAFSTGASENPNFKLALDELVETVTTNSNDAAALVFLFVGQYHAEQFEEIVEYAQTKLDETLLLHADNDDTHHSKGVEVVAMLGGGVIGGGNELDNSETPGMTILSGSLPPNSHATVFQYEEGVNDELPEGILAEVEKRTSSLGVSQNNERPPSYMVFSDPFAPLEALLNRLDEPSHHNPALAPPVVAGGVTVPLRQQRVPSLSRNGQILPAGSLVGVAFTGNVGLLTVVAQGCRPVGPTFVITQASNNILTGLSGKSAIEQLEEVARDAEAQDQELIRNGELVCGIGSTNSAMVDAADVQHSDDCDADPMDKNAMMMYEEEEGASDFLIRQIMGFQPKSGSIVVAAGGLKEGSTFRFHVRAAKSAQEDMKLMIQRAKTERLFVGSSTLFKTGPGALSASKGKPLAAFQLSCVARGSGFYGSPNVDLSKVESLFENNDRNDAKPPIAGFFANGEIGPVGIRMAEMAAKDAEQSDRTTSNTFLHGFTTVVAMLCDYSDTQSSQSTEEISTDGIMSSSDEDAWA